MQIYRNLNGDSGVAAFEIGHDYILVQFKQGQYKKYTYTYASVGQGPVEAMKLFATQEKGLNSYINEHENVKRGYASRAA